MRRLDYRGKGKRCFFLTSFRNPVDGFHIVRPDLRYELFKVNYFVYAGSYRRTVPYLIRVFDRLVI